MRTDGGLLAYDNGEGDIPQGRRWNENHIVLPCRVYLANQTEFSYLNGRRSSRNMRKVISNSRTL